MDSWTLQGDSYSFLHSAPHTFSQRHRDGTPNHVEIFDITNIPSHRGAISETTCLCDIFGDDCESPSLSSSPASGTFIRRALGDRASATAASPLVQKRDDFSGSCRAIQGSIDVREKFEDSGERKEFDKQVLASEHLGQIGDSVAAKEPKGLLPPPGEGAGVSFPEVSRHIRSARTPSPGITSPNTPTAEGRGSSLSSSSADSRSTLSPTHRGETHLSPEPLSVATKSADRHSSPSHQPSPSSEARDRARSCSPESAGTPSFPESRGYQLSPDPRNITSDRQKSSSPEAKGFTSLTFEPQPREASPKTLLRSHSPTFNGLSSQSRESSLSPGPRTRTYSSDTQGSSPFPERRGRVSLPDLFSRSSTPEDSEGCPPTEGSLSSTSTGGTALPPTPEGRRSGRSAGTGCSIESSPAPGYTPPPRVSSLTPASDHREGSVTPEGRGATPSSSQLSEALPAHAGTPSPALSEIRYATPPTQRASSPPGSHASGQYPDIGDTSSSAEARPTAPSPDIRITASSPLVDRRARSPAGDLSNTVTKANPLRIWSGSSPPNPRSLASSPHISGISYSILQPEGTDSATGQEPTPRLLFPTPSPPWPETTPPPTALRDNRASAECFQTPTGSPRVNGLPRTFPDTTASPEPGYHTPMSEPGYLTPSPRPLRREPPSPQHRYTHSSPAPSPQRQAAPTASSPSPQDQDQPEYKQPDATEPSPQRPPTRSPQPENTPPSATSFSPQPDYKQPSPPVASTQPDYKQPSPTVSSTQLEYKQPSPSSFSQQLEYSQPYSTVFSTQPDYKQPCPNTISTLPDYKQPSPNTISTQPDYKQPSLTSFSQQLEYNQPSPTAFSIQSDYKQCSPNTFSTQPDYKQPSPTIFSTQPDYNQSEYTEPVPTASSQQPEYNQPSSTSISMQPEFNQPEYTQPAPTVFSPKPEHNQPSHTAFSRQLEHNQPSPTVVSTQPDYKQPSPNTFSPQPEYNQHSPTVYSPKHEYNQPCPTDFSQQPEYNQPSPTVYSPKHEYNQPSPTAFSQQPEYNQPCPTAFSQQPEYNKTEYADPVPIAFSQQPEYKQPSSTAFTPQPEYNQGEYEQPFSSSPLLKPQNYNSQPLKTPESVDVHLPPDTAGKPCSSGYFAGHRLTASPVQINAAACPLLTDSKNCSPRQKIPIQSPEHRTSPCTPEMEKRDSSVKQRGADREIPFDPARFPLNTSVASPTEKVKWISPLERKEGLDSYSPHSLDFEATLPDPPASVKGKHPGTSPALKSPASSPVGHTTPVHRSPPNTLASSQTPPARKSPAYSPAVQQRRDGRQLRQPPFLAPESRDSGHTTKSQAAATEHLGKQPITHKNVTIVSLAEGTARHGNRRRSTPSPPLTRFTPVHIIPPEKPQRQWQNRGHSPSRPQAKESPPVAKRPAKQPGGGSPRAASRDGHSQPYWVRLEKEMERQREREREWEEEKRARERERERQREGERQREERAPGKGEGRQEKASNREEQVELSFSARNRKGPASRSTAPTSKETHRGMPAPHSYSESLPGARQLQQQQHSLPRAQSSQLENRGAGGPSQKSQSSVPLTRKAAAGRVAAEGPGPNSGLNMGSELEDSDDEVKWFSDLAFRSLSSPEVDYLDMYNSSHRSSTNASQPSTQDSPAGANAAWLAYADLRGSAPRLDGDEHQQPGYYSESLDPAKHFEMGSFECVDVAVEREEIRKVRRGVPKRQIQLKRKDTIEQDMAELKNSESDGSSPLVPAMVDSPSIQRRSRETLVRQNSTPAAMPDSSQPHPSPEPAGKPDRKSRLQKSVSLDETSPKTKMATCLIKSVLSKKMQNVSKQSDQQVGDEVSPTPDDETPPPEESPRTDKHSLSSSLQSDGGLPSDTQAVRREPGPNVEVRKQKSPGVKPIRGASHRTSNTDSLTPQADTERSLTQSQRHSPGRPEMRSELVVPFDSKKPTRESVSPELRGKQVDDGKGGREGRDGSDSANAAAGNTGALPATGAGSTRSRMSNSEVECQSLNTGGCAQKPHQREQQQQHQQQQDNVKTTFMSKTPEINLKTNPNAERKKSSLNVSLTPELENTAESKRESASPEKMPRDKTEDGSESTAEARAEDEDASGKSKGPMHKVRDVRKLVKNKYNLSFKAASVTRQQDTEEITEEKHQEGRVDARPTERGGIKEATKDEHTAAGREEKRKARREEKKVEMKESKFQTVSPSLQRRVKPLCRSQPMQIECKAVSWRENKDKATAVDVEAENLKGKAQSTPPPSVTKGKVPEAGCSSREPVTRSPGQMNTNVTSMDTGRQIGEVKPCNRAETEKPELAGRDRKPPMLGSIPKVPSKDREVSSTVVVLTDGSSKTRPALSSLDEKNQASSSPQAPSTSHSPGHASPANPGSSSHSVSMLVREKGYQADIGAVVADGQGEVGVRGAPFKHINRLEIPLQTCGPTDGGGTASQGERTVSSSSSASASASSAHVQPANPETSGPPTDNTAETARKTPTKIKEEERVSVRAIANNINQNAVPVVTNTQNQTNPQANEPQVKKSLGDVETAKKQEPFSTPRSPALRRFKPQPIEVKSVSKEAQKQEAPSNRPQPIEVRSIANHSQKPVVPPKPNYKFRPADLGSQSNETQSPAESTTRNGKEHAEVRPVTGNMSKAAVSSPGLHRRFPSEPTTPPSNYRKLAVSAVSSCRPPQSKTTTSISSVSHRSAAASAETEGNNERTQQQQQQQHNRASPQTSGNMQRPTTLPPLPTDIATSTSATAPLPAPVPSYVSAPAPAPGPAPAPAPGPAPAPAPVPAPVPAYVSAPAPVPAYVSCPAPGPAPAPAPAPVPAYVSAPAPVPAPVPAYVSAPGPVSAPVPAYVSAPAPVPTLVPAFYTASQSGQPAVADLSSQSHYPRTTCPPEQTVPPSSNHTKQPTFTTQAPGYAHPRQPYHRSLSSESSQQREDELRFYALDDAPPSYDDRESFSPLMLPDLKSRKLNRYHPSSCLSSSTIANRPPCSCTSGCPSYPGLPPPAQHHHHSPHNITPPASSHSPGHCLPYPSMGQPPLRSHQGRPDPQQPMSYPPSSPKSSPLSSGQAPAMYHHQQPPPPHQGPLCPPHPSLMQPCPGDRAVQPPQHMDPRRPPTHRSPQQHQPPPVGGGPYGDHGHSHSPNLPALDPQYMCGPQSLGPAYGSEYGGDSSSLYSDGGGGLGYGQTPRRVLMDPETGKYFYIEVPLQPLRKMLFDPETGQYVEVLIPQQTMSHTGLYPPSAAPYPSLHNPNMYAPAPQYLPYTAPPPHTQAQSHAPHHPEAPAPGPLHQNGAGISYRGQPGPQAPKPEPQSHPALDHSYLESMYYDPTGMNASPNLTPPDCYHKHPASLPNAGGKRS